MRYAVMALMLLAASGCSAETPAPSANNQDLKADLVPIPSPKPKERATVAGALCGDPRLAGTTSFNIRRPISACGVSDAVKVTSIAGIKLTTPAVLNCKTATIFADWLTGTADEQARRTLGGSITKVWVMGAYSCRTRNSQRGARLSEHAYGRAIDVGGMWLSTGRRITVKQNWGKGSAGQFLRRIWKAACGPFKTVLGPDGDRFHQDHLHFDNAKRRSTFCR